MEKLAWNECMRLCRERHGYLQKELSSKLGISKRTLQRYENGECEPTISILIQLSQIYDLSIDDIIGNETDTSINRTKIEKRLNEIIDSCNLLRHEIYETE